MTKPFIGINTDFRGPQGKTPSFSFITTGYFDCIQRAGGIPVMVPPSLDEDDLNSLLDWLDGFMLIGGADLDPRNDGFQLHPAVKPLEPRRERFDRLLASQIVQRRIPAFGIGLGMQLLNLESGGNLFLHIPEDVPNAIPHRDPLDFSHRHSLEITPGSLIERVYGDGEIRVNSRHHMAIDEVAPVFSVTARCPDGVIEVIESTAPDWFAIGTQFHPESEAASALDMRIFEEFIEGVRMTKPETAKLVA
ncbi:MAG: gamma-glutamyl-gamma-aminobutyrate hydrolase family protein [Planctomycetota bacterium]|nr:gamma-glutamyl-gamma-aminobutyrate hydrolase family protein [Planctomycetota bacterium]